MMLMVHDYLWYYGYNHCTECLNIVHCPNITSIYFYRPLHKWRNTIAATPEMLTTVLAHVGTAFIVPLLELVEAILGFEKSSSDAKLQEMLCGLKKIELTQLCKKYRLKSSGNKPKLIGRLLKKWKNNSSASMDEESMGALTLRHELCSSRPRTGSKLSKVWATSLLWICICTFCRCATKHSIVRIWRRSDRWRPANTLQTILLGMCTLAIFLLTILLQSNLTVCRLWGQALHTSRF